MLFRKSNEEKKTRRTIIVGLIGAGVITIANQIFLHHNLNRFEKAYEKGRKDKYDNEGADLDADKTDSVDTTGSTADDNANNTDADNNKDNQQDDNNIVDTTGTTVDDNADQDADNTNDNQQDVNTNNTDADNTDDNQQVEDNTADNQEDTQETENEIQYDIQ